MLSPLALKSIRLDGVEMAAVSYGLAFAIALVAGLLNGERLDTSSLAALLATSGWMWAVQQAVYQVFKAKLQTPHPWLTSPRCLPL